MFNPSYSKNMLIYFFLEDSINNNVISQVLGNRVVFLHMGGGHSSPILP